MAAVILVALLQGVNDGLTTSRFARWARTVGSVAQFRRGMNNFSPNEKN